MDNIIFVRCFVMNRCMMTSERAHFHMRMHAHYRSPRDTYTAGNFRIANGRPLTFSVFFRARVHACLRLEDEYVIVLVVTIPTRTHVPGTPTLGESLYSL